MAVTCNRTENSNDELQLGYKDYLIQFLFDDIDTIIDAEILSFDEWAKKKVDENNL